MASFTALSTTTAYATLLPQISDRDSDLAMLLDPAYCTPTNVLTNSQRLNSALGKFQKYNGTSWVDALAAWNVAGAMTATVADSTVGIIVAGATSNLQLTGYNTSVLGAVIESRTGATYKTLTLNGTSVTLGTTGAGALTVTTTGAAVIGLLSSTTADGSITGKFIGASGRLAVYGYLDATNGVFMDALNTALSAYIPWTVQASSVRLTTSGSGKVIVGASGVDVTGTLTTTGNATIGTSSGQNNLYVNSAASGTGGGSQIIAQAGGAAIIAIGNKSALLGGSYDATPYLYGASAISTNVGLNISGNTAVTGTLSASTSYLIGANKVLGTSGSTLQIGDILNNYASGVGLYAAGASIVSVTSAGAAVTGTFSATGKASAAAATTSGDLVTWQQTFALGQSYVDETASRAIGGGPYTNATAAPIQLKIKITLLNTTNISYLTVDGTQVDWVSGSGGGTYTYTMSATVMPGKTYSLTSANATLVSWLELR